MPSPTPWTGRPPDFTTDLVASWDLLERKPEGPPISASAVNPHGQTVANRRFFLAGALIGIAGGMLIEALHGIMAWRPRRHEGEGGQPVT